MVTVKVFHDLTATWVHGSHTINFWQGGENIDCITFHWELDRVPQVKAMDVLNWWTNEWMSGE